MGTILLTKINNKQLYMSHKRVTLLYINIYIHAHCTMEHCISLASDTQELIHYVSIKVLCVHVCTCLYI